MSDSEAAADAADNIEQREGQGPGNSEANTAPRSVRKTPSRKRKASRPRKHRRKRSRYEPDEETSSDSSDSSEDSDSSASGIHPKFRHQTIRPRLIRPRLIRPRAKTTRGMAYPKRSQMRLLRITSVLT